MLIILALLSGWLVTELKDFMSLGGVSNYLAFGLLKICFIMFLIALVIGGIVFPEVVMEALKRIRDTERLDDGEKKNGKTSPLPNYLHRRLNSQ